MAALLIGFLVEFDSVAKIVGSAVVLGIGRSWPQSLLVDSAGPIEAYATLYKF
jgi:hypothetical protein